MSNGLTERFNVQRLLYGHGLHSSTFSIDQRSLSEKEFENSSSTTKNHLR